MKWKMMKISVVVEVEGIDASWLQAVEIDPKEMYVDNGVVGDIRHLHEVVGEKLIAEKVSQTGV